MTPVPMKPLAVQWPMRVPSMYHFVCTFVGLPGRRMETMEKHAHGLTTKQPSVVDDLCGSVVYARRQLQLNRFWPRVHGLLLYED